MRPIQADEETRLPSPPPAADTSDHPLIQNDPSHGTDLTRYDWRMRIINWRLEPTSRIKKNYNRGLDTLVDYFILRKMMYYFINYIIA